MTALLIYASPGDKIRKVSELTSAWREYVDVLAEVAPLTRAAIRPATGAINRLRSELGLEPTVELAEWFSLHDGAGYETHGQLLPINFLVSLDEAIKLTTMTREICAEFEEEREHAVGAEQSAAGTVARTWLPEYVYIGNDTMGGGLFVDIRSGALQGCVRNWDDTEADDDYGRGPIAASLAALITMVSANLRTGAPIAQMPYRAVTRDGQLDWTDVES